VCHPISSPSPANFAARLICDFCKLSWWYGLPVTGLAKSQSSSLGKTEAGPGALAHESRSRLPVAQRGDEKSASECSGRDARSEATSLHRHDRSRDRCSIWLAARRHWPRSFCVQPAAALADDSMQPLALLSVAIELKAALCFRASSAVLRETCHSSLLHASSLRSRTYFPQPGGSSYEDR
jgi:hypothetical protein